MSEQDNLPKADGIEESESKKIDLIEENHKDQKESSSQSSVIDEPNIGEDTIDKKKESTSKSSNKEPKKEEDAIDEIDSSNAEDAEDEGNKERHVIEFKEYDKMSMDALVIELDKLVKNEKAQAIKAHVEGIRSEFKSKFNALLEEKKEEFLNEGGHEIDFYYSSPLQKRFKSVYKEYRNKLHLHYKNIENSLKDNLANRLEIIEEIKGLINVEENINTTYKHFKELQERWKHAGPIPRDKYNNAWNSYHHHVEIFYDFLHLNRDLRDLDFKYNLEKKLKIIEQAEELAKDDNITRAFRELQALHKMWKEELGPVAKEHRDDIWKRFKDATKTIHDKRQAHFAELEVVYEKNLNEKLKIIDAIKTITEEGATSHSLWQKKIKEIEALRESFFNAGKVPIKANEETWAKFKNAVRVFNKKKNSFYKDLKKNQYENLQKKLALIKVAEDNKDSEDFETITPLMKKIQSEWKSIGHVPRKDSDKIWKQFKAACNSYFDKLHANRNSQNKEQLETYNKKVELLQELKGLKLKGEKEEDIQLIKDYIVKWKDIGFVPNNKRYIEGKFYKALDHLFEKTGISKNEIELIKYDNKLEVLNNNEDSKVLDNELSFIRKKIDEVKGEINQLENNLQFFTNVENDNPLVQEVNNNIKKHKDTLKLWKSKLKKIKALY